MRVFYCAPKKGMLIFYHTSGALYLSILEFYQYIALTGLKYNVLFLSTP